MQEESTEKTISLSIKTAKLTADILKKAMTLYLNRHSSKSSSKTTIKSSKMTVKELVGQNAGITNIEITDKNIKSFERVARKYGVDFALKKDKTQSPPKYLVFFKARDTDAITQAFKEYTQKTMNKGKRRQSLRKVLQKFKQQAQQQGKKQDKQREEQKLLPEGQKLLPPHKSELER